MTNAAIILNESIRLMKAGILSGSGRYAIMLDENGAEKPVELPEPIHTFAAWKQAGYIVKKGEHAIARFTIWKYAAGRNANAESENPDADGEETTPGRMFLKQAFFFKASQVERIQNRA